MNKSTLFAFLTLFVGANALAETLLTCTENQRVVVVERKNGKILAQAQLHSFAESNMPCKIDHNEIDRLSCTKGRLALGFSKNARSAQWSVGLFETTGRPSLFSNPDSNYLGQMKCVAHTNEVFGGDGPNYDRGGGY